MQFLTGFVVFLALAVPPAKRTRTTSLGGPSETSPVTWQGADRACVPPLIGAAVRRWFLPVLCVCVCVYFSRCPKLRIKIVSRKQSWQIDDAWSEVSYPVFLSD